MSYTKGEWKFEDIPGRGMIITAYIEKPKQMQPIYNVSIRPQVEITDDGRLCVTLSYSDWRQFPSDDWREMQRANGRLMTSAPELLEACKEVLNMPRQFHIPCALVTKLGQAIAKAEGR